MTKPMIKIHNTETDEIIEREMTADEIKSYKESIAKSAAEDKLINDQIDAKKAIFEKIGLTADEAALLIQ